MPTDETANTSQEQTLCEIDFYDLWGIGAEGFECGNDRGFLCDKSLHGAGDADATHQKNRESDETEIERELV